MTPQELTGPDVDEQELVEQCSALGLVDKQRCTADATSKNGLFCRFHSRQCQGLYAGYKRRNAKLDYMRKTGPQSLTNRPVKLVNDDFGDIEDINQLRQIHDHLFTMHALLDRVIQARSLHHSHFYAESLDYGHKKYIDSLVHEKETMLKALERADRRIALVLYQQQEWFQWVKENQEEDDKKREKKQKLIQKAASLFKRQVKEFERRIKQLRAKEEAKKQEEFLDTAYHERRAQDEELWDPIDDVLEDERGTYIDLIKHFLWMERPQPGEPSASDQVPSTPIREDQVSSKAPTSNVEASKTDIKNDMDDSSGDEDGGLTKQASRSKKKKKKSKKGKSKPAQPAEGPSNTDNLSSLITEQSSSTPVTSYKPTPHANRPKGATPIDKEPDITQIESRQAMAARLEEGGKLDSSVVGLLVEGTRDDPKKISDKLPAMSADDIEKVLVEIEEIKYYLFCRLLLAQVNLLPAAMRAGSIEEFFSDAVVTTKDLRDLCLKMEQPRLQDIRDACADFFRRHDETEDFGEEPGPLHEGDEEEDHAGSESSDDRNHVFRKRPHKTYPLPKKWKSKREKTQSARAKQEQADMEAQLANMSIESEPSGNIIDFGHTIKPTTKRDQNIRIKLCGRYVYYYPSERPMTRKGWLHFSIITKNISLYKTIELCRCWEEFFQLNVLANHIYFPSPDWILWSGGMVKEQLLNFGFIPFYMFDKADSGIASFNQSKRTIGGRRVHAIRQSRNFICAQMKRNDWVSRRFIQYATMQTYRMLILVRDGKTGRIIVSPEEDELWLAREKIGIGRANRQEWKPLSFVGAQFFDDMEKHRTFRLSFDDYYDVFVWNTIPGDQFTVLYTAVNEMLHKAYRVRKPVDTKIALAPYLKTITTEKTTGRVRDIRPETNEESVWEVLEKDTTKWQWRRSDGVVLHEMPPQLRYKKADELEDQVLFPDEPESAGMGTNFKKISNKLIDFEHGRIKDYLERFALDLDTDEEVDDFDENGEYISTDDDFSEGRDSVLEADEDEEATDEEISEEERQRILDIIQNSDKRLKQWKDLMDSFGPGPDRIENMEEEYLAYIDQEKATVFKEAWHACDFEPGAVERWDELLRIRRAAENHGLLVDEVQIDSLRLFKRIKCHPLAYARAVKDMDRAYLMTALYFPVGEIFFSSSTGPGTETKSSLLFNQKEKRKALPDRRTHHSNRYRDKQHFQELYNVRKESQKSEESIFDKMPEEWDTVTRPLIAKLFAAGVIRISYKPHWEIPGQAFATIEDDRPMDLFIDYTQIIEEFHMADETVNPTKIPIESFLQSAQTFANKSPTARFSLLRIRSAPHFYPLMIGYNRRIYTAFRDCIERTWEWKFIPKDMPYSEHSVHINLGLRLEPYKAVFRNHVQHRKDVVLILAEDEKELLELTAAVTFAIQTKPWRLEVDYWKSFVNVDIEFLDSLQTEWWE